MQLTLCVIALVLLTGGPITCWFLHDRPILWMGMLIAGEIFAVLGSFPVLIKTLL